MPLKSRLLVLPVSPPPHCPTLAATTSHRRRLLQVQLVAATDVPKRGKGGSLLSRQRLLHSLVHIENVAVDLAWDAIARFGGDASYQLPKQFYNDFVTVRGAPCPCWPHMQLQAALQLAAKAWHAPMPVPWLRAHTC